MLDSRTTRTSLSDVGHKAPVIALGMLVASALGIGLAGTATAETTPTVSLTVDGTTSTVTTTATTVEGLLNDRNVRFDDNDLLSPQPTTTVSSGLEVDLTHAVKMTVVDDGSTSHRLVTAVTVSDARTELDLSTASRISASAFEEYRFERATVYGPTGGKLNSQERVREGSRAVVHDVRVAFPAKDIRVKPRVVKDRTKLLPAGSTRVYRDGRHGRKHIMWRKTFVERQLVSKKVARSRWIKAPHRRVVRVGTGPNWAGLARCESGGNPNAVNPSGYYGLYQFSLSTWQAVGGRGNPTDHGYWEQTKRAWILYRASGRSPWPNCGRFL